MPPPCRRCWRRIGSRTSVCARSSVSCSDIVLAAGPRACLPISCTRVLRSGAGRDRGRGQGGGRGRGRGQGGGRGSGRAQCLRRQAPGEPGLAAASFAADRDRKGRRGPDQSVLRGLSAPLCEDVSKRLDGAPAQFRVVVVRRPRHAYRARTDGAVQAPAPAQLIEGGCRPVPRTRR